MKVSERRKDLHGKSPDQLTTELTRPERAVYLRTEGDATAYQSVQAALGPA